MPLTKLQLFFLLENNYYKYKVLSKIRKKRRQPVEEIYKDRIQFDEFHQLYSQLLDNDHLFYQFTRMKRNTFNYILEKIREKCSRKTTNFKKPISVEERLIVTLRYLATGLAFRQIALTFKISKSAVSAIVVEVCMAIWEALHVKHMSVPNVEKFEVIANEFYKKWNFPHCLGCIDGKHIRVKRLYSIVLMAVVDANYKFIMVDLGPYREDSDGGVFGNSQIFSELENGNLKLPSSRRLPNWSVEAPFVFVGDEAFPLKQYLMKPFPARQAADCNEKLQFNYRLSRTRTVAKCAFGISATKFRILLKPIETKVENAVSIVKTCCLLHNITIDLENDKFSYSNIENSYLKLNHLSHSRRNNRSTNAALEYC
ncbi:uncharacterized protein LOC128897073 isoform X2 [Hylaeus anthracinus]|uniref:uncharacterized protein LOC128897073 isoform X2 n=1 Tax=Hylaeus anthracinus TaxID=313031 RepID=UPI0023B9D349|nr:uncharacterized protein LOC128897073 isoform X2 [Hylaeus anthracinus]